MFNRNCLSYWFPRIEAAGLPVPRTLIVRTSLDLSEILDGEEPTGWAKLIRDLREAINEIGLPCFLRTGQTSNKHDWTRSCFLTDMTLLGQHVYKLIEFSACCDIIGLPTNVWAVRELIQTKPLFTAFRGFPVTREFRVFAEDGRVHCVHPYFPANSIEGGYPSDLDWRAKLEAASQMDTDPLARLCWLAMRASRALPGAWSIDLLEDAHGSWWITDAADAGCSFHWQGCENEKRWPRLEWTDA